MLDTASRNFSSFDYSSNPTTLRESFDNHMKSQFFLEARKSKQNKVSFRKHTAANKSIKNDRYASVSPNKKAKLQDSQSQTGLNASNLYRW